MPTSNDFLTGVIEGFYGEAWPLQTRLAYAGYLAEAGLDTYIYCPKGDAFLRSRWREDWPQGDWQELEQIARTYAGKGVAFGVGLSPVELYLDYGEEQRQSLRQKVQRIADLGAPLLAILFDDMPGDLDALAERQAEIVCDVCHWSPGVRVLACPTYYSFDPLLEQHFGDMPSNYWPDLGRLMPAGVDLFWTGEQVCSESISVAHLESVTQQIGRPVILWDNYPVNDGGTRCEFLYTSSLSGREMGIEAYLTGHLCNPMNQGLLSLPALAGLSDLYNRGGLGEDALARIFGQDTYAAFTRDRADFERKGRAGLGESHCQALAAEYAQLPGEAAREIAAWLRGEYVFDPACLT